MLTVSDTAYAIALIRAQEADLNESERLFHDPFAHVFASAGAHAREGVERFLSLPFFREGIRLRTRHIDDVVENALAAGMRQLVFMGAGFDTRALRFPQVAELQVQAFEIDLPPLLETKRRLLEENGTALPEYVHHVGCDFLAEFEAQLSTDLLAAGFQQGEAAMFVWEGVIAYIGHEAIDKSLRWMASVSGTGSRVVFDFSEFLLEPVPAHERTRRAGFERFEEIGLDALWRRHLPGDPMPMAQFAKLGIASK